MHPTRLPEAHFRLCRMHIRIDLVGRKLEEKAVHRLRLSVKHVLVRGAHGVRHHAVANKAAVHKKVLRLRAGPRNGGKADQPGKPPFA